MGPYSLVSLVRLAYCTLYIWPLIIPFYVSPNSVSVFCWNISLKYTLPKCTLQFVFFIGIEVYSTEYLFGSIFGHFSSYSQAFRFYFLLSLDSKHGSLLFTLFCRFGCLLGSAPNVYTLASYRILLCLGYSSINGSYLEVCPDYGEKSVIIES